MSAPPGGAPALFPPHDGGHAYFRAPADPRRRAFDPAVASWMADAAMLCYGDDAFVRDRLRDTGLALDAASGLATTGSTQCQLFTSRDVVIVAFRGTELPSPYEPSEWRERLVAMARDVVVDANALPAPHESGHVHRGVRRALSVVWDALATRLMTLLGEHPSRPIWFTGHSLGGALATLAASGWTRGGGTAAGVYTFGAPAIGDAAFDAGYRALGIPTYRVVHGRDLVARLPGGLPWPLDRVLGAYEPLGTVRFLADGGGPPGVTVPPLTIGDLVPHAADLAHAPLGRPRDEVIAWLLGILPTALLVDHAPVWYATILATLAGV